VLHREDKMWEQVQWVWVQPRTYQNLCFGSSNLGFAHCNIALSSDESLGSLGREHTPGTLVHGISGGGTVGQALAEEGKHDSKDSEDKRQYEERVVEEMVLS
jgi:hypothetical protein